ncbi:MAG: beta-galactosidase, partial [Planctomycetaceae bacterium]|nr:beta-galactosidase [Planctomycetaceae bacterium]
FMFLTDLKGILMTKIVAFFKMVVFGIVFLMLWSMMLVAAEPSLTPNGIKFPLQGLDDLIFSYPNLQDSSQKDLTKIFDKSITNNGNHAVVKYEGGTEIVFVKKGNGLIEMSIKNPPNNLAAFRIGCNIPFAINEGGKYSFDNQEAKPFPMEKPAKPHLYQGNTQVMQLTAPSGATIHLTGLEQGTFFQLQDNREWNWSIFHVWFSCPYNKDHATINLTFSSGKDMNLSVTKMVDRFGQDFVRDFPDKISSEEELQKDAQTEKQYYDSFSKQKNLDIYGGFEGSGKLFGLKKTGFFHVEKSNDQWFLVNPNGNAFFHLGLCSFNPGEDYTYTEGRESIFEWLPPRTGEFATAWNPQAWWNDKAVSFYLANVIRKYGKPYNSNEWAARMIDRVRAFGFTSGGAFSSIPATFTEKQFPHVRMFGFWGLGYDIPGARGFFDAFNPELVKKIDNIFANDIAPHANDPLVIGYYLANEQGAEDLPRALPALSGQFVVKKKLVGFLEQKYGDIKKFNTAWEMQVDSFNALLEPGLPVTTKSASEDITEFTEIYLDQYYSLLSETFRKYDKNHLLLGSRWQPGTANNEMLVRICAKYCDIISVNYYTVAFDVNFLNRLEKWSSGKPMLLSEWHYTCTAESALPGGLGGVNTQTERGLAYRNYVEQAAATGYVVGVEWFTLLDQARAGRFFEKNTGEKANTGLFSVTDRPWKNFVAEVVKTNKDLWSVLTGQREPFRFDDPRFVTKSQGSGKQTISATWVETPLNIDGSRDDWPGQPPIRIAENRMVLGTDSAGMSAAFRVAWDAENLYVFVDVTDKTSGKSNVKGADLWQGDCVELFVGYENLDKPGNLIFSDRQILLGANPKENDQTFIRNAPKQQKNIKRSVTLKPDGTGYYLETAIPFTLLGFIPKEGQEILFDIAIDDSEDGQSRQRQFVWNGDNRVSGERGGWGRIRFIK